MTIGTIIAKIIDGRYDTRVNQYIVSYDRIFHWLISREKSESISINIYSFDFLLIFDEGIQIFEPTVSDDGFIACVNNQTLPRYAFTITQWLKDMYEYSILLSDHMARDVIRTVLRYIV